MGPYEASPMKLPATDLYADLPHYGRYLPRPSDFQPDRRHRDSSSVESLKYWDSVLARCDEKNRLYEGVEGGRDVFAVGGVIMKSSHLHSPGRNYCLTDKNEVAAIGLVRMLLERMGILVPTIHFAGRLRECDVLIQSRIPGVALNVAWPYLSRTQKSSFKAQARRVLHQMRSIPSPVQAPSYIISDDDPMRHRNITQWEYNQLFGETRQQSCADILGRGNCEEDLSFMHNDLTESNIIVDKDRIVGIVDWEMAGYFSWQRVSVVHAQGRAPKRDDFSALNLDDERLADLTYWNDLYA